MTTPFALEAHDAAGHAGIAATWTAAERQAVARFLRQEAACLEALP